MREDQRGVVASAPAVLRACGVVPGYHPASARRRRDVTAVRLVVAVAAIAVAVPVRADPVRFDNPPPGDPQHFEWAGGTSGQPVWLDLLRPPADQVALTAGPSRIGQYRFTLGADDLGWLASAASTSCLVVADVGGFGHFLVETEYDPWVGFVPHGHELWSTAGYSYHYGYGSRLAEGLPVYLGVRFDPGYGDGLHYGWVGVQRAGTRLDALAWGYDTEPAPEPGTLVGLAFGTAVVVWRRRAAASTPEIES
jgi:hypothetical protein